MWHDFQETAIDQMTVETKMFYYMTILHKDFITGSSLSLLQTFLTNKTKNIMLMADYSDKGV